MIQRRRTPLYLFPALAAAFTLALAGSALAQDPHMEKSTTTTTVSPELAKPHPLTPDAVS